MNQPNKLPPLIIKLLEDSVFNNVEFIGKFGNEAVYSFSLISKEGIPMATGLPYLALVRGEEYRIICGEDSFKILDKLTPVEVDLEFYKEKPENKVWWCHTPGLIGELMISFDKKEIFNLWTDYHTKLTPEQREIFNKENPYWADFFKGK